MNGVKRRASSSLSEDETALKQLKKENIIQNDIENTTTTTTHSSSDIENGSDSDNDSGNENESSQTKGKITTSAQDIHIARETAELFKSNIFKLQIDELLEQVKLNNKHILKVEKFFT